MMLPSPMQGSLPAGWLAFAGREFNPLDHDKRFQFVSSSSSGFILAQGKFHFALPERLRALRLAPLYVYGEDGGPCNCYVRINRISNDTKSRRHDPAIGHLDTATAVMDFDPQNGLRFVDADLPATRAQKVYERKLCCTGLYACGL